jgi:hypothetical protein
MFLVSFEIPIERKDCVLIPHAYRAEKEIRMRPLDPMAPARVGQRGCQFIIFGRQFPVIEGPQFQPQLFELPLIRDSRKKFLANGS